MDAVTPHAVFRRRFSPPRAQRKADRSTCLATSMATIASIPDIRRSRSSCNAARCRRADAGRRRRRRGARDLHQAHGDAAQPFRPGRLSRRRASIPTDARPEAAALRETRGGDRPRPDRRRDRRPHAGLRRRQRLSASRRCSAIVRPGFALTLNRDEVDDVFEVPLSLPDGPGQPHARTAASGTSANGSSTTCPMATGASGASPPASSARSMKGFMHDRRSLAARRLARRPASAAAACRARRRWRREARVVGGAVRNSLIGQPVADIDIATTCLPEEVDRAAPRRPASRRCRPASSTAR